MKKKLLIIQSLILLLPIITSFLIDQHRDVITETNSKIHARFLEIIRAEGSISDNRLEYIEMMLLRSQIFSTLNETDNKEFEKDFDNIKKNFVSKYDRYKGLLANYENDFEKAEIIYQVNSSWINFYENINLIASILALMIALYLIVKYRN